VLDDEKARFNVFKHKTVTRYAPGGTPNLKLTIDHPHTEMYLGTFDSRR
jgi:hypothetical protein